jgi:hypothetical protein
MCDFKAILSMEESPLHSGSKEKIAIEKEAKITL